jgi:hypothetical protein
MDHSESLCPIRPIGPDAVAILAKFDEHSSPSPGMMCTVIAHKKQPKNKTLHQHVADIVQEEHDTLADALLALHHFNLPIDRIQIEIGHDLESTSIWVDSDEMELDDEDTQIACDTLAKAWNVMLTKHAEQEHDALNDNINRLLLFVAVAYERIGAEGPLNVNISTLWYAVSSLPNFDYLCDSQAESERLYVNLMNERGWKGTLTRALGLTASKLRYKHHLRMADVAEFDTDDEANKGDDTESAMTKIMFLLWADSLISTEPKLWGEATSSYLLSMPKPERTADPLWHFVNGVAALTPELIHHYVSSDGEPLFSQNPVAWPQLGNAPITCVPECAIP